MASLNESLFNTPAAKRALKLHESRIAAADKVRQENGLSPMNFERKLATAVCLENTRRQIRTMDESYASVNATQASSIGQYKRFALDMVTTIMPTMIAPEVVGVQAIDNRVGMINILEYQYGSNKGIDKIDTTFASPIGYQGMSENYTSALVENEEITVNDEGVKTVAWTPVRTDMPYALYKDGVKVDNATIDVDGKVIGDADTATYFYNNETVPVQAPTLKMNVRSLPITTQSRKLSAIWSFDSQWELTKEYGQDMHTLLATQAASEIEQEIDNEITKDLYRIANAGPEVTWSRQQSTGVNLIDHVDTLYYEIIKGSNQIFAATRRVHANFMVCGINVASVLKVMRNFDDAEDKTAVGPHFIGTVPGIRVFVNPNYDPDVFVLGYKGASLIDTGYVYAPYLPVMTTGMLTFGDDFSSREGWACMYGKKAINPRMYIKGRIF